MNAVKILVILLLFVSMALILWNISLAVLVFKLRDTERQLETRVKHLEMDAVSWEQCFQCTADGFRVEAARLIVREVQAQSLYASKFALGDYPGMVHVNIAEVALMKNLESSQNSINIRTSKETRFRIHGMDAWTTVDEERSRVYSRMEELHRRLTENENAQKTLTQLTDKLNTELYITQTALRNAQETKN
ncbi:MAG: hypothetical protein JSS82_15800 [Bacteroidetes bacterium]|nr:hypothetical protein [Bacteroidota bacterium]